MKDTYVKDVKFEKDAGIVPDNAIQFISMLSRSSKFPILSGRVPAMLMSNSYGTTLVASHTVPRAMNGIVA